MLLHISPFILSIFVSLQSKFLHVIPFICPFFFLSNQIFCYKFLIFCESQSLQILYVYTLREAKYIWTENKTAEIYFALSFLFSISRSNVIYIGKFVTNISQELLHTEFCNLIQMLWIICYFMSKRTRLLLLILPLISSFLFLSNFQISNNFISLFSGTERPTKLKLGPHMDSRLVYHVCIMFQLAKMKNLHRSTKLFQHTSDGYGRWYVFCSLSAIFILKFEQHGFTV